MISDVEQHGRINFLQRSSAINIPQNLSIMRHFNLAGKSLMKRRMPQRFKSSSYEGVHSSVLNYTEGQEGSSLVSVTMSLFQLFWINCQIYFYVAY